MRTACSVAAALVALTASLSGQPSTRPAATPEANARRFERAVHASERVLQAWLKHADPDTLLLPDYPAVDRGKAIYTPHNSGADLYPYLILTAQLTDPELYEGRLMEMLRNEVRYTTVARSIPGNLTLADHKVGPASFFGAAEYAKDGLIAVPRPTCRARASAPSAGSRASASAPSATAPASACTSPWTGPAASSSTSRATAGC
jgi:hypothetical protein